MSAPGPFTGGCQCGAVRFRAEATGRASICHCRMCQKAFGSAFGPLVSVKLADLTWTRGEPKRFASSNKAARGFCADCGTPLTFEASDTMIDLAIGAFDDPAAIPPTVQLDTESALSWFADLQRLPHRPASEAASALTHHASVISRQHPDRDTEQWP